MGLTVAFIITLGRLCEMLPGAPVLAVVTALIILPTLPLLGWCLGAVIRRPRRDWPGLPMLLAFCFALIFGFDTLITTGARLNFLSHRPVYERILGEARAGRLPLDENGWSTGRRYGVAYATNPGGHPTAQFEWGGASDGFFGVVYDEWECFGRKPPAETPRTISAAPPPVADDGTEPPVMKNAGRLGGLRWPLSDDACLMHIVW